MSQAISNHVLSFLPATGKGGVDPETRGPAFDQQLLRIASQSPLAGDETLSLSRPATARRDDPIGSRSDDAGRQDNRESFTSRPALAERRPADGRAEEASPEIGDSVEVSESAEVAAEEKNPSEGDLESESTLAESDAVVVAQVPSEVATEPDPSVESGDEEAVAGGVLPTPGDAEEKSAGLDPELQGNPAISVEETLSEGTTKTVSAGATTPGEASSVEINDSEVTQEVAQKGPASVASPTNDGESKGTSEPTGDPSAELASQSEEVRTGSGGGEGESNDRQERRQEVIADPKSNFSQSFKGSSESLAPVSPSSVEVSTDASVTRGAEPQPASPDSSATAPTGSTFLLQRPIAELSGATSLQEPSPVGPRVDASRFVNRVARAFQAADQRGGSVQLRLSPPELGAMRIELSLQQGVLTAKVETESAASKSLLLDNLPALRERLAAQEIRVDKFEVDVREQGSESEPDWGAQQRQDEERLHQEQQRGGKEQDRGLQQSGDTEQESGGPVASSLPDGRLNVVA